MAPHPVDIHVGKCLRLRRTMLGMSQEALGDAIGVTFQQIQKYERGINRIGSSRLFNFARILGVGVSYFFETYDNGNETGRFTASGVVAEDTPPEFSHEQLSNRETLELVRAFHKISDPQVRKKLQELIKSLARESSETPA